MRRSIRFRNHEQGFVLIAVLSVMALLSGITVTMLALSRNSVDTASLSDRDLTSDAMVQSAISMATYQLFVQKLPAGRVDGQQLRLDDGTATLSVLSEATRIDLNGAGQELLETAYRASNLKTLTPEIFAARVMDWRDSDDVASLNGAEAVEYAEAGVELGPRNSGFRFVDDLRWVLGMTAADVAILHPLLTVNNPRGRLDALATPKEIIAALPGMNSEVVEMVVAARTAGSDGSAARLEDLLLVQSSLIDAQPPAAYSVTIRLNAAKPRRVTVVLASAVTPEKPYRLLQWLE